MRTPLYPIHKDLSARFTHFAGWEMPLEYTSIKEEALSVRKECGLFDISHMGRLILKTEPERLSYLTSRSVKNLKEGKVQYNLLLNSHGGVKDDITIYRLSEKEFFVCTNAINKQKVIDWFLNHKIIVEDISQNTLQFALQGPKAQEILSKFFPIDGMKYYTFKTFSAFIISRTGYTGEDGFEVYAPLQEGMELFKELLKECKPCGLGARDVLRIEAGFPLYGHELSEDIDPFSANLDRFVELERDFIAKEVLQSIKVERKLFGLVMEKGIPREGYAVYYQGKQIGTVSSGTFSPTLGKGIALCFIDVSLRKEGLEVEVEVRGKRLKAFLRRYPFVEKSGN